jgi:four helix bundle protein
VIAFVKLVPRTQENLNSIGQLTRSASSIAANYIEAIDNLGRRDFVMKLRTSRREARESELWLDLIVCEPAHEAFRQELRMEAFELVKILSAMIRKTESRNS